MNDPIISIVIPCLNEAETLGRVLEEAWEGIRSLGVPGEVIVADNGSTDGSQKIAVDHRAIVVPVRIRGYGAALHFGILAARGEWVLFADGDLSYDFRQAVQFKPFLLDKIPKFDLVLGSRLKGDVQTGAMPFLNRHLGTPVLNMVIRLMFGLHTSDCNSGMRLIRKAFYENLKMRGHGMEWASELLVKSKLSNVRYAEVPISLRKDGRSRSPHLRRWRDGWRHLKTIVLLSPNRMILLPGSIMITLGIACAFYGAYSSFIALCAGGSVALLLGLSVKLILHHDGVRTSRLIQFLIDFPTAELLLGVGVFTSFIAGIPAILFGWAPGFGGALQLLMVTTGTFLVLGSFFWGSVITHAVNRLPEEIKT